MHANSGSVESLHDDTIACCQTAVYSGAYSHAMATDVVEPVQATPHHNRFIPIVILIVILANIIVALLNENNWISKRFLSKPRGLLFLTNRGSHVARAQRPTQYMAWDIISSEHLVGISLLGIALHNPWSRCRA